MLRRTSLAFALALLVGACGGDAATCGGGARPALSVWAEQRGLGAAFTLEHARPDTDWRLTVVHEGHIAWRGGAHTDAAGALKVVRRFGDYPGVDHVSVRAIAPDGATCAATVAFAHEM
jgi:hypothetical protein